MLKLALDVLSCSVLPESWHDDVLVPIIVLAQVMPRPDTNNFSRSDFPEAYVVIYEVVGSVWVRIIDSTHYHLLSHVQDWKTVL